MQLVISDHHLGLKAAIAPVFIGASWQRCRVHFMRNVLAQGPQGLSRDGRRRHPHDLRPTRRRRTSAPSSTRSPACSPTSSPTSANCCATPADDVLAFTAFPQSHWRKIWSTNPLERLNGRSNDAPTSSGIFPNDAAIARLVTAVLVETHDEWAIARRYLSEASMARLNPPPPTVLKIEPTPTQEAEQHTPNPNRIA